MNDIIVVLVIGTLWIVSPLISAAGVIFAFWFFGKLHDNEARGCDAWVDKVSGELAELHYDKPIGWYELPK